MRAGEPLKLVFFPPSPWSERARWALEYSGLPFEAMVYTPLLSTLKVRWMTRNFSHKLTVPAAINENFKLTDSLEIAQYANDHRQKGCIDLFPEGKIEHITQWNQLSEFMLDRLRFRSFPRMQASDQLKLNNLPAGLPDTIKPYLVPLSDMALRNFARKYPVPDGDHDTDISAGLKTLRNALKDADSGYLLKDFSYADMTMAVVFQCIAPIKDAFVPMDPAMRECWTDSELIDEFKDLVEWRDRIYELHRPKVSSPK